MSLVSTLIARNAERWQKMKLDPARIARFDVIARNLTAPNPKRVYQEIEKATKVPWWVVAVIHQRESNQNFDTQLGQGDPLGQVSRHDPAGRGPFFNHASDPPLHDAFYRAALDALIDCAPHASRWPDWSTGGTLTLLEEYNGLGYAMRGVPSAYVWSGTDQYVSGKYVADHVYRAGVKDVQEGCAPIIWRMLLLDKSIKFGPVTVRPTDEAPPLTPAEQAEADKVLADKGLVAYLLWKLVKHG
jgi:lysozyme family protein